MLPDIGFSEFILIFVRSVYTYPLYMNLYIMYYILYNFDVLITL